MIIVMIIDLVVKGLKFFFLIFRINKKKRSLLAEASLHGVALALRIFPLFKDNELKS